MVEIKISDTIYNIPDGITIVGRGEDADITIDSQKLSRTHARFTVSKDKVFIEDLGSKNGIFINGEKIEEKRELAGGDAVKLGDIPCSLSPSKPDNSATARTRPVKPVSPREEVSTDLHLMRNLVFAGIIILVFVVLWALLGSKKNPGEDTASKIILQAKTALSVVKVTSDNTLNQEWLEKLALLKNELGKITDAVPEVYIEAQDLITGINMLSGELKDKIAKEDPEKEASEAYEKAVNGLKSGLSSEDFLARLKTVVMLYPGTRGAGLAQEKIFEIEKVSR